MSRSSKKKWSVFTKLLLTLTVAITLVPNLGVSKASAGFETVETPTPTVPSKDVSDYEVPNDVVFEHISTVEDFKNMKQDGNYILDNDIDYKGANWTPKYFYGRLEGNGHTIKNVNIVEKTDTYVDKQGTSRYSFAMALFEVGSNASFTNLTLDNIRVDASKSVRASRVAVLASQLNGAEKGRTDYSLKNVTVKNSYVKGRSTASVGGVVGYVTMYSSVENVKVENTTVSTGECVGGAFGEMSITFNLTGSDIDSMYRNITVTSTTVSSGIYNGGIAGKVDSNVEGTSATNLFFDGNVDSTGRAGGLFGKMDSKAIIKNSFSTGVVKGSIVGSFVGESVNSSFINSHSNADLIGSEKVGGFIGSAYSAYSGKSKITNSYYNGALTFDNANASVKAYLGGAVGENYRSSLSISNSVSAPKEITTKNDGNWDSLAGNERTNSEIIVDKYYWSKPKTSPTVTLNTRTTKEIASEDLLNRGMYENELGWDFNTVWGIDDNTPYNLKLASQVPNYANDYFEEVVVDLSKPTSIKSTKVTDNSLELTWDSVNGATKYDVLRDGVKVQTVTETTFSDKDLDPNKEYTYKVVALDVEKGRERASDEFKVTTLESLSKPQNVSHKDVTNNSLTLTWDYVDGATEYDIVRDGTVVDTVNEPKFTDSSLDSNRLYVYNIVARDANTGRESQSGIYEVKTAFNPLSKPKVSVKEVTKDSVTIQWDKVEEATNYLVSRNGEFVESVESLNFSDSKLTPNTKYSYTVTAVDYENNRESEESTIEVTTDLPNLEVPKNIKSTNVTSNSITLEWDVVDGASTYEVFKDGVSIGSVDNNSIDIDELSSDTTYKFEVQAKDSTNNIVSEKASVSVKTNLKDLEELTNLKADTVTNNSVLLKWDEVDGAEGYVVERNGEKVTTVYTNAFENTRLTSDTVYEYKVYAIDTKTDRVGKASNLTVTTKLDPLKSPTDVKVGNIENHSVLVSWGSVEGATEYKLLLNGEEVTTFRGTSYYLGGLDANTVYTFSVKAVDSENDRVSAENSVMFKTEKNPLREPNNLGSDTITKDSILLKWEPVEDATSYKVIRDGVLIGETIKTEFLDKNLLPSTNYEYTVVAVDNSASTTRESKPSSIVLRTKVGEPSEFKASNVTKNSVDLSWLGPVNGTTKYLLERNGQLIFEGSLLNFKDEGLDSKTMYSYRVYAQDTISNVLSLAKEMEVTTLPEKPTQPENFRLYGSPSSTSVVLNWDMVEDAEIYTLKRDGKIIYQGSQQAYREDEVLPEGKTYNYTLTASNASGTSEEAVLSVNIEVVLPQAPENLRVSKVSATSFTITFDKVLGVDKYAISLNGKDIATIDTNTYTFDGLEEGKNYVVAVSSINEKGSSKQPSVLDVKTTMSAPNKVTSFKASRVTPTTVNLQWDKIDTAKEYEVYRDGTVLVYKGTLSTFQDTTVSPETEYGYTAYAVNDYGKSVEGANITVTTPKEVQPVVTQPAPTSYNVTFDFKVVEGVSTYKISRNPEWTYTENEDGTFDVNSVNSVTGESKSLGTVEVSEEGFLPFNENLTGAEGSDLKYNIVGIISTNENGEEVTTDPIEVDVKVPETSENPSKEGSLSNLQVSTGDLKPTFNSSVKDYEVELDKGVSTIKVVPTTTDKNATVTVDGIPVSSGKDSQLITVGELPQKVIIEVTAEDRTTKEVYTVTLKEKSDSDSEEPNPTEPTEPTNPDDGDNGEDTGNDGGTEQPTNPDDDGNVEQPTNPDDDGNVEQPTNPDDDGNVEQPTNPDDGDNGSGEQPTDPDNNGDNGSGEQPTNPDDSDKGDGDKPTNPDDGGVEQPTNPDDGGNVEQPTNPDGDNGNGEQPTNPDDGGTIEQPTNPDDNNGEKPTNPDNGDSDGEDVDKPTNPDDNGNTEQPTNPDDGKGDTGNGTPNQPTNPDDNNSDGEDNGSNKPTNPDKGDSDKGDGDKPTTPIKDGDKGEANPTVPDNNNGSDKDKGSEVKQPNTDKSDHVKDTDKTPKKEDKGNTSNSKTDSKKESSKGNKEGNELPNTSTSNFNYLLVGLVVLLAGVSLLVFRIRRRDVK